jgi:hypothetical protein
VGGQACGGGVTDRNMLCAASQIQHICEVTLIGLPCAVQQKRIQLPLYLVGFKRIYKRPAQMKKNSSALFTPIGPVSCQRTGSLKHPRSFLLQNQKQLTSSITTHMKGFLLSLVAIAAFSLSSFGQSPEGFKYQAVVRDAGNLILSSQAVGMQLTIQQGSIGGTAVYTETFAPTTNAYGLVNLEIGSGTSADDFTTIDWANGPYFMETAVDVTGGTSYSVMGTSQLMSVPYALYANTSGNGAGPAGADGIDGVDGLAGTNGSDGATGPQGPTGIDGPAGADGIGIAQTLLISGDTLFISSGNYILIPGLSLINSFIVEGCTDPTALNYDASANTDDGSCIAVVNGCTDPLYAEYDASANTDDGSCATLAVNGCTDPTATNYNASANTDDGSCILLPANDNCATAEAIACGGSVTGSTSNATASGFGGSNGAGSDIWYSFTGTGGVITVSLLGSSFDTYLRVYDACGGTEVAFNDDVSGSELTSAVTFTSVLGTDYKISCGGYQALTGGVVINLVTIWYLDADGDNYAISTTTQCTSPGAGYAMALLPLGDCDDTDVNINPGAPEMPYDGIDNDCNTATLDDDLDGDGYVNANDCNDTDAAINPATVWFIGVDTDGDTFFGSTTSLMQCESPGAGYALTEPATLDCDESLATGASINPGVIEVLANGIDDNCDGQVDEVAVGQLRDGGIVFWVDPADNAHGKVCALEDAPLLLNWADANGYCSGYTNSDTGTGVYSNWYLPNKNELQLMYANLHRFGCATNTPAASDSGLCATRKGGFSNGYWCSTQVDGYSAWQQYFNNGFVAVALKYGNSRVRAVRPY